MKLKFCLVIFVAWLGNAVSHHEQEGQAEPSSRLLTHALMLNGVFMVGNPKDSENPSNLEDLQVISFRPVDIPALNMGITYYFEFLVAGNVVNQEVVRMTETEEGFTKTEAFALADPSKFTPGTFDIANLTALQESDIGPLQCAITFKETRRGNFKQVSNRPGCTGYNVFRGVWTCKGLRIISLVTAGERTKVDKYWDRYPLSAYLKEKTQNFHFRCNN